MIHRIEPDLSRFRQIVRGKIKQNLKKYISRGELVGKQGDNVVSIPLPHIDLPRFRYGQQQLGGVGQGEGEEGTPLDQDAAGGGQAGERPGEHVLEVDVTLEELAEILGEELELPKIQPRGERTLQSNVDRYTGIHRQGPESLRHFKRTFKQALKRQVMSGMYDPERPVIIPIADDRRYRSWKTKPVPESSAVVIYMMDVSGSMGNEQKEIVRIESFWIDTWLKSQYREIETRYVIHDAAAKEVDSHTFFHVRESGGTRISSAYQLCREIIEKEYNPTLWNVYPFHFSDGDNWGGEDTALCMKILKESLLPVSNAFCYGQVKSAYGSGQFIKDLRETFQGRRGFGALRDQQPRRNLSVDQDFLGEGEVSSTLTPELAGLATEIRQYAVDFGLDFFEVIFELLDYDELNMVASYGGFPTRYPHWKFGMQYEELSKNYSYGLQKIYELVINNDPCYAYLMTCNNVVDQKLVMAHVYGHSDFFKSNYWFSKTNRKMMDEIANHGTRIRRYMERYGHDKVEEFVDCCLSLENLIDYHSPFIVRRRDRTESEKEKAKEKVEPARLKAKSYMDSFINPPEYLESERRKIQHELDQLGKFPEKPERDVLLFLLENAKLERWQRDILSIIREEAYYFAPQGMTKIMNEGWASYWHSTIMTEKACDASEIVDYADHHAATMGVQPGGINPYKLGLELFRDIETRWNQGKFGPEWENCDDVTRKRRWDLGLNGGREKIFQVRKVHNDVTFIDEFLTPEFVENNRLFTYSYNKQAQEYVIDKRDFESIKEKLLFSLSNFGQPYISVEDGNFHNRGELYLIHRFESQPLRIDHARATIENLFKLWQRPVHLETTIEKRKKILSYNGAKHDEKIVR